MRTQRLIGLITGCLVILALASIARSGAQFLQDVNGKDTISDTGPATAKVLRSTVEAVPDVPAIVRLGWFGPPPEDQRPNSENNSRALAQLTLKGISQSDDISLDGAYIAEKNKPEAYYRVGDELPGNAGTLEGVFADHVAVRHGQALATLKFEHEEAVAGRQQNRLPFGGPSRPNRPGRVNR